MDTQTKIAVWIMCGVIAVAFLMLANLVYHRFAGTPDEKEKARTILRQMFMSEAALLNDEFEKFTQQKWTLRDARTEQKSLLRRAEALPQRNPKLQEMDDRQFHLRLALLRRADYLTEVIAELEPKLETTPPTPDISLKESIEQLARKHVKDMVEFDKLCHELELEYPSLVIGTDGLKHFWRNFKENQRHRILGKK